MIVHSVLAVENRLQNDFDIIEKLGEGTFGEAFKVISKADEKLYAVKRAKEPYLGLKDREQKLQEVAKALRLSQHASDNSRHCIGVVAAWEEAGHLYIQTELCAKGNLNDYLLS